MHDPLSRHTDGQDHGSRPERLRRVPVPAAYDGPPVSPVVLTIEEFREFPPIVLALLDAREIWYPSPSEGEPGTAVDLLTELASHARREDITRVPFRGGHYWRIGRRP